MLRISLAVSTVLCTSFFSMSQVSYAETVSLSIGSGDTKIRHLSGKKRHYRRRRAPKRVTRKRVSSKKVTIRAATIAPIGIHRAQSSASISHVAPKVIALPVAAVRKLQVKPALRKKRSTKPQDLAPIQRRASIQRPQLGLVKVKPHSKSGAKPSFQVKETPKYVFLPQHKVIKPTPAPKSQLLSGVKFQRASVLKLNAPVESQPMLQVRNKPELRPEFVVQIYAKPMLKPKQKSAQRRVYERYVADLKAHKDFRAVVEKYTSFKKQSSMLKLLNYPEEMRENTLKMIISSHKCMALTFLSEELISKRKAIVSYETKDLCGHSTSGAKYEVVELISEQNHWKINRITMTNMLN